VLRDHLQATSTQVIKTLVRYWLPVLAYAGLIFFLSSLPHPETYAPALIRQLGDKLGHAIEYGVLGILCYRAFRHAAGPWASRYALLFAIVVSVGYGITDEVHQAFVPLREPDGWDLLMDTLGSSLAALAWCTTIEP
jgi:VanZ family protein